MLSKFRLLCLYCYKFFENYVPLAKGEEGDIVLGVDPDGLAVGIHVHDVS